MNRKNTDPYAVQWFDLPAHYVTHFVNSWEETNKEGDLIVKLFGIAYFEMNIDMQK